MFLLSSTTLSPAHVCNCDTTSNPSFNQRLKPRRLPRLRYFQKTDRVNFLLRSAWRHHSSGVQSFMSVMKSTEIVESKESARQQPTHKVLLDTHAKPESRCLSTDTRRHRNSSEKGCQSEQGCCLRCKVLQR